MKKRIKRLYNQIKKPKRMAALDTQLLSVSKPLKAEHLTQCRVFPNRESMIRSFPFGGIVAEVGVAKGAFSSKILELTSPRKLYLIDAWAMQGHPEYGKDGHDIVVEKFKKEIAQGIIKFKKGWSWDMLGTFEDKYLDWVYIDAAHDYNSVKKDLETALKKVKSNGIIAGHDYTRWGKHGKRFGVLEAVNEFCIENNCSFIALTLENNYNWSYALMVN